MQVCSKGVEEHQRGRVWRPLQVDVLSQFKWPNKHLAPLHPHFAAYIIVGRHMM